MTTYALGGLDKVYVHERHPFSAVFQITRINEMTKTYPFIEFKFRHCLSMSVKN